MRIEDARRHAQHLCDVWPTDETDEHIGVIEKLDIRRQRLTVSGHPEYPAREFWISEVETSCKIED